MLAEDTRSYTDALLRNHLGFTSRVPQISLDSDRLSRHTQRKFSAAWLEDSDAWVNVLPHVAHELTNRKFTDDIDSSIEKAERSVRSLRQRRKNDIAFIAECDLWWLEELRREDSPYHLVSLDENEAEQAVEVRHAFPVNAFPGIPKENLIRHGDAIIISEALVSAQNLFISCDTGTIRHAFLNEWILANSNKYGFRGEPLIFVQDEIISRLFAGKEDELLYIALGASWPTHTGASDNDVLTSFEGSLVAMSEGATLPNTARLIRSQWREVTSEQGEILTYVREHYLPERMRQSEARHPSLRMRSQTIIR